jgi:hypothetical protein
LSSEGAIPDLISVGSPRNTGALVTGKTKVQAKKLQLDFQKPAVRGGRPTLHTSPAGEGKRRRNLKVLFDYSSHGGDWSVLASHLTAMGTLLAVTTGNYQAA